MEAIDAPTEAYGDADLLFWKSLLPCKAVLAEWIGALDLGSFVWEDKGSNPSLPNYLVWDGGQWGDSVILARANPALNEYLEKSGEGKQEWCTKAQDGWPQPPTALPGWRAKKRRSATPVRTVKSNAVSFTLFTFYASSQR